MSRTAIGLISILIALLAGSWFLNNFERVPYTSYKGYSGEARYNDFYAAELLLKELDIEADSRASMNPDTWTPEAYDTLVARITPALTGPTGQYALVEWVMAGGHLVLLPPNGDIAGADDLLNAFNMELWEPEKPEDDGESSDEDDDEDYTYIINLEAADYRISYTDEPYTTAVLTDDLGNVVAQRMWGEGIVTVVASDHYFRNYFLDDLDHARFFLDIVAGSFDPGTVWFVYDTHFDPLWAILWANAPAFIMGAIGLLLLWLWSRLPRFGPRIHQHKAERRSIMEHLLAAGHFAWRENGAQELQQANADAVIRAAERVSVGIARKSLQEQVRIISRATGIPEHHVMTDLSQAAGHKSREFRSQVQRLQHLRKQI